MKKGLMDFTIKRNDTRPAIRGRLKYEDGSTAPIGINDTVRFKMRRQETAVADVDALATVLDGEQGIVEYAWLPADTDTAGEYFGEFEVTYSDGRVQTFPNKSHIRIHIIKDI